MTARTGQQKGENGAQEGKKQTAGLAAAWGSASFGMGIRDEKEGLDGKQKTAAGLAAAWGSASPATGARKKR